MDLRSDLQLLVKEWLASDWEEASRAHIQALATRGDAGALRKLLGTRLKHTTSGLRALMGPGFARLNHVTVVQTTQGLCRYVEKTSPAALATGGIVVGCDGRHNSRAFANLVAAVFISQGHKVHLFREACPTPFVSYGIARTGAAAGVIITASHNPKEYNGYKMYWGNSALLISPHDKGIAACVGENLALWDGLPLQPTAVAKAIQDAGPRCPAPDKEMASAYIARAAEQFCFHREANALSATPIVYTAMHGVGAVAVARQFEAFGLPPPVQVREQEAIDPDFPTVTHPNPEDGLKPLALATKTAERVSSRLVLANDPDADRLAVAERCAATGAWRCFSGNDTALLLADWLWTHHLEAHPGMTAAAKAKVAMIASTASSKVLRAMAEKEGFTFFEALTGFKWMGNRTATLAKSGFTVLLAYEVEIGFMLGHDNLDKDGVKTAAVVAEMANYHYSRRTTLEQKLASLYARYGHFKMISSYYSCADLDRRHAILLRLCGGGGAKKADGTAGHGRRSYATHAGSVDVVAVRDLCHDYDSSTPDRKALLPCSTSKPMVTYTFSNGAVATFRGSGNEPKLKFYIEVAGKTDAAASALLRRTTQEIIADMVRPQDEPSLKPAVALRQFLGGGGGSGDSKMLDVEGGPGAAAASCLGAELVGEAQWAALCKHEQEHILASPRVLGMSPSDRASLLAQLRAIDVEALVKLYGRLAGKSGASGCSSSSSSSTRRSRIEPLPSAARAWTFGPEALSSDEMSGCVRVGEAAIAAGQVAAVLMAGGAATRLGLAQPKAVLDIGLPSGLSLLGIHARRLLALRRRLAPSRQAKETLSSTSSSSSSTRAGLPLPWYIMTSPDTHEATRAHLVANDFFGLDPDDVFLFPQATMPVVLPDATRRCGFAMALAAPSDNQNQSGASRPSPGILTSPDGHGGVYAALRRNGCMEDMARREIRHVFIFAVDNVLCQICDPAYVGHCIRRGAAMGYKVVPRRGPDEPAGVVCIVDGKTDYVEYSELSPEHRRRTDPRTGALAFDAANILNLVLRLDFLEGIAHDDVEGTQARGDDDDKQATEKLPKGLPFHLVRKAVSHLDPSSGAVVRPGPAEKNARKFEKLALDCTRAANDHGGVAVWCERRAECFAPIKNAFGSSQDSPDTALRMLSDWYRRRVERCGGRVEVEVRKDGAEAVGAKEFDKDGANGRRHVPAWAVEVSPLVSDAELCQKIQEQQRRDTPVWIAAAADTDEAEMVKK